MPSDPRPAVSAEEPPTGPAPRVSVVIPAWNRRDTLRMSVESVLRQTFADFELIVVDDGSTDGTMGVIADLADPRIRRLATPHNMGASGARNLGIRAAQGEWVAFQDSDDEWLPRKLEKQMARLEGAGPEVVACYTGMLIVAPPAGHGGRTNPRYHPGPQRQQVEGDLREAILSRSLVSTQMLMARRETLLQTGGFDETLPALVDWECMMRLVQRGQVAFVDEPLVLQSFSDNSITRDPGKRLRAMQMIVEKHRELLNARPQVLANHLVDIAGTQRRLGNLSGARVTLNAARRVQPFSVSVWLRLLRVQALSLKNVLGGRTDR